MQLQIGVKVLIKNHKNEYLFIRRSKLLQNETTTSWDIPGGRIESDESLTDALRREVKEELDIMLIGDPKLINAQDIFVAEKQLHVVRLTYTTTQDIGDISLSHEHQDHIWVSQQALPSLTTEPFLAATLQQLY